MKTLALLLLTTTVASSAAPLQIGTAAVRITPPTSVPMAGYYSARTADSVHDDLYAKALLMEQNGAKAALVVCDLISLSRPVVEEARALIEKSGKIRGDCVMISATHSHTGPVLIGRSSRDSAEGGPNDAARRYVSSLPELIAESVRLAEAKLTPAHVSAGVGHEEALSFNRRFFMKDGSVGWNPGKLNPNIVKPAGPIDPAVPVVYFASPEGKPLSTYVNFAMHLDTVGGLQISADYPYTLAKLLGKIKGSEMLTIFSTGACGDINHINVSTREPQKGHEEAARIGTILAGEVIKTYARLKPISTAAPRVARELVKLPLAEIKSDDVEKARQIVVRTGKDAAPFLERVHAYKVLDVAARNGEPLEVEVQVIACGRELAWVSLPGEIFVELGLAIKKGSPFKHTIIAELANGSIGYVPTRRAYGEGNYEAVSARCAAGSGEMLVEAALKLLKQLAE